MIVDISMWKPFFVGDLFSIEHPAARVVNRYSEGDMPFVASGSVNNGISNYFAPQNDDDFDAGGCLTVSPLDGSCFWQSENFLGRGGSGASIVILRCDGLTELPALFVASCIRRAIQTEAGYQNLYTGSKLADVELLLPATPDGEPDWAYMEDYMRQVMDREAMFAEHLASLTAEAVADGHVVDTSVWKAFKVGDLFEVFNGKKYVTHTRVPGPLPLISNSAVDNGIGDFIAARLDNVWSNFISVAYGSGTGIAFYHEKAAFVGETVMALVPRFDMTSNVGLFIAAVLTRYGVETYKYERKPKVDEYRSKVSIELPATPDGTPDWAYMEQYMRDVMAVEALFADELDRLSRE